jgi:hypothetical protein
VRAVVLLALVLLALVFVVAPCGAATVEDVTIKGAGARIVVPDGWNGGLFIYAHGYTGNDHIVGPIPEQIADADPVLWPGLLPFVPAGYATAITTFRSAGWDVKDALKDVENLRRWFTKHHGKPTRTYLWGHSEGGMITETVIEYFPHTYDGAAPMCGTGAGGRRLFDAEYDLRVLYEYTCRDVADARFACGLCTDGTSRCVDDGDCPAGQSCGGVETPPPPEDGLTRECFEFVQAHPERFDDVAGGGGFVTHVITPCLGEATPTAEQAARRDFLVRASQLPANQLDSDLFFASVGLAEDRASADGRTASVEQHRRDVCVAALDRRGAGRARRGRAPLRLRRVGRALHAPVLRAARADREQDRDGARARRRPRHPRARDEVPPGLRGRGSRRSARPVLHADR